VGEALEHLLDLSGLRPREVLLGEWDLDVVDTTDNLMVALRAQLAK
jgi:hypothetical protein